MFIISASPDVNIPKFISMVRESDSELVLQEFAQWNQDIAPDGFVYIKVMPEISFKRLKQRNTVLTLEHLYTTQQTLHSYFVDKTTMPHQFHSAPVLILNGFIDFESDFSQFYNHLFYIKKLFQEIKEKKDKEKGVFVKKKHSGCKC